MCTPGSVFVVLHDWQLSMAETQQGAVSSASLCILHSVTLRHLRWFANKCTGLETATSCGVR